MPISNHVSAGQCRRGDDVAASSGGATAGDDGGAGDDERPGGARQTATAADARGDLTGAAVLAPMLGRESCRCGGTLPYTDGPGGGAGGDSGSDGTETGRMAALMRRAQTCTRAWTRDAACGCESSGL